jgi:hypothetical protein
MPRGGFAGNRGGQKGRSGRKSKAAEMGLQSLLDKCWTQEDREQCVTSLAHKANAGDIEAIKLLMAYTFGKPKESVGVEGGLTIRLVDDTDDSGSS